MQDQAFAVLDAIRRGFAAELAAHEAWVAAFQTIRWAQRTEDGWVLTPAGRQALDDMRRTRRVMH